MSVITVITCDTCNPIMSVTHRGTYVGPRSAALSWGWIAKRDGSGAEKHICPECRDPQVRDQEGGG